MTGVRATITALVGQAPAPPPGRGEEFGKTSPIALVVIVLLGLATILLIRSMNKRLRNVPASFDEAEGSPDGAVEPSPDSSADAPADSSTRPPELNRSDQPPRAGSP